MARGTSPRSKRGTVTVSVDSVAEDVMGVRFVPGQGKGIVFLGGRVFVSGPLRSLMYSALRPTTGEFGAAQG